MENSSNRALISIALFAPRNSRYRDAIGDLEAIGTIIDKSRPELVGEVDLAIFLIEADRGLSSEEIADFHRLRELQLPTLILVAGLASETESSDQWDFDDVVMLINRVLEPSVAPFLVLHGDDGNPSGLFDLANNKVVDYSSPYRKESEPDEDLLSLTKDFRDEFQENGYMDSDFVTGLRVVTLPFIPERAVGLFETAQLLTKLQQALI